MSARGWGRLLFRGARPPRSEPRTVDVERSRKLSQQIRARDRRCYENVLRALPLVSGARLVIGFAASIALSNSGRSSGGTSSRARLSSPRSSLTRG
jgi:hypothetical protein